MSKEPKKPEVSFFDKVSDFFTSKKKSQVTPITTASGTAADIKTTSVPKPAPLPKPTVAAQEPAVSAPKPAVTPAERAVAVHDLPGSRANHTKVPDSQALLVPKPTVASPQTAATVPKPAEPATTVTKPTVTTGGPKPDSGSTVTVHVPQPSEDKKPVSVYAGPVTGPRRQPSEPPVQRHPVAGSSSVRDIPPAVANARVGAQISNSDQHLIVPRGMALYNIGLQGGHQIGDRLQNSTSAALCRVLARTSESISEEYWSNLEQIIKPSPNVCSKSVIQLAQRLETGGLQAAITATEVGDLRSGGQLCNPDTEEEFQKTCRLFARLRRSARAYTSREHRVECEEILRGSQCNSIISVSEPQFIIRQVPQMIQSRRRRDRFCRRMLKTSGFQLNGMPTNVANPHHNLACWRPVVRDTVPDIDFYRRLKHDEWPTLASLLSDKRIKEWHVRSVTNEPEEEPLAQSGVYKRSSKKEQKSQTIDDDDDDRRFAVANEIALGFSEEQNDEELVIDIVNIWGDLFRIDVSVAAAEIMALHATPMSIVPSHS